MTPCPPARRPRTPPCRLAAGACRPRSAHGAPGRHLVSFCFRSASRPTKSPLVHDTTHSRPALRLVMPGPSSWPCNGSPASSRSVSRAPRPAGSIPVPSDRSPHVGGTVGRNRELNPVLAGVAGTRRDAGGAVELEVDHAEPPDCRSVRHDRAQHGAGLRALDRDHGPIGRDVGERQVEIGSFRPRTTSEEGRRDTDRYSTRWASRRRPRSERHQTMMSSATDPSGRADACTGIARGRSSPGRS